MEIPSISGGYSTADTGTFCWIRLMLSDKRHAHDGHCFPVPYHFYVRCDSIYAIARICYVNSIRLSVSLPVTRVHCIQMAEHIIEILSLSARPIILVFRDQCFLRKSDGFTPNRVAEYKGVAIFDQYAAISWKR